MVMSNLSAREQVGQRMVAGFAGTEINDDVIDLIKNYKISNFILFKENITSLSQLKKLCENLQQEVLKHIGKPAFICVDQEGGMVTRLDQDGVNMPGAMALAATGKKENAYLAAKITAMQLKAVGINFNFAPTADVNSNIDNPVIGVRSFGDRPDQVAEFANAYIKGLLDGGVLACAKHFPGHGDTNVDSHLGLPVINKSLEELKICELIPFVKAIEAGVPAIMTSHILFPKLEPDNLPATMSPRILINLLREELKFNGLVVSDSMEMKAIADHYGTLEGTLCAAKAGVDLVCICHNTDMARKVSDALLNELEEGSITKEEMRASVERILLYKEKFVYNKGECNEFDIEWGKEKAFQLLKESITPVQMPTDELPDPGESPLFIGVPLFRATNVSNLQMEKIHFSEFLSERLGGMSVKVSPNPTQEEIEAALQDAESYSCILIGTYNGHLNKGQLELIKAAACKHHKVIVFALRNPYDLRDLPKSVYGIAVYEYTQKSLEVIAQLLEKQFKPEGRLPVSL